MLSPTQYPEQRTLLIEVRIDLAACFGHGGMKGFERIAQWVGIQPIRIQKEDLQA
jgi:hypothetical protein